MTEHHESSLLAKMLMDKGIRLTRQRRILLGVIESASDHLHASDLLRLAREQDPRIDRATVYRTLSMMKEHGLVEELDLLHLDGSEHHYELKRGRSHVHIGCIRCGRILEFQTDLVASLAGEIREQTGCDVDSIRIEASALCRECRTGD
ncbi:MAG: Fur family transcriptional regulator [Armatimonadota bacterium]